MAADPTKLICRFDHAFSNTERSNFKNLWESAAAMCRPMGNTIQGIKTPGERKSTQRLIDIGIQSLNTFGSGLSSTLFPRGSKFFKYDLSKTSKQKVTDPVKRWLNECTNIAEDFVNESNFFTELSKSASDLGLIGTSMVITEPDDESGVRFKSYYIDSFAFEEDSTGRASAAYFRMEFTAYQLEDKFGADKLPHNIKNILDNGKESDQKFEVLYCIYPRAQNEVSKDKNNLDPTKMKYAATYILRDPATILKESGFNTLPSAICRWSQASNETYGRSPAIESDRTLSLMNAMEYTKLRTAQRVANPQWLAPNDGTVRNLNNDQGGVVFYNAANPAGKPEQLIDRSSPQFTDNYLQQKEDVIKESFFVHIFNPLIDKQNMTLGEVAQRMAIANQNLIPNIARVIDELLIPTFKNIFNVLLDGGHFPDAPEALDTKNIKVTFVSKAAMAVEALESSGSLQWVEQIGLLSQVDPAAVDYINSDEIVKMSATALAVPNEALRSDLEVKKIRATRAEQEAARAQAEQAKIASEAYSKTNEAPEDGSPGAALMSQMGIG